MSDNAPTPDEVAARYLGADNVAGSRDYLRGIDVKLDQYISEFVYGQVYAGSSLDPKTRALCTVAMLAATGNQLQLGVYVQAALRTGANEEQIREVLRQVAVYAGFPAAWNALVTANKAFSRASQREIRATDPDTTSTSS